MRKTFPALAALALVTAACATGAAPETPDKLTLISHDSFASGVSDDTFAAFTAETGIEVEVVAAGDAGSLVNQAVLTKDNPLADVLFGVDDTFLSRALDAEIFRPYRPEILGDLPPDLIDREYRVTPIDFGDVCLNYDKEWFENTQIQVPTTLDALRADLYASALTVEHPATSSPGLAFMLATIDVFGEDGWLDFWADLRDAGVNVAPDWDTAYFAEFTRYGGDSSIASPTLRLLPPR